MTRNPSLTFRLNHQSGLAPYRQLVDQVRQAVRDGLLQDGDQLPSVRDVVTQITINPNTVHRAYRELEHQGVVEGRAGLGTFITWRLPVAPSDAERASLELLLRDWVTSARRVGLSEDAMNDLMRSALRPVGNVNT